MSILSICQFCQFRQFCRFVCQLKHRNFSGTGALAIHLKDLHPGQKPFECAHCDVGFLSQKQLEKHYKSEHGKQRNYKCEPCGKAYALESQLKIHMNKIHNICLKNKPGCKKKNISIFSNDGYVENQHFILP